MSDLMTGEDANLTMAEIEALLPSNKALKGIKRAPKAKYSAPNTSDVEPPAKKPSTQPLPATSVANPTRRSTRRYTSRAALSKAPSTITAAEIAAGVAAASAAAGPPVNTIDLSNDGSSVLPSTSGNQSRFLRTGDVVDLTNLDTESSNSITIDDSSSDDPEMYDLLHMDMSTEPYVADPYDEIDLDNDTIKVVISWGQQSTVHNIRRYQKFRFLFYEYAAVFNVEISNIFMHSEDIVVEPYDSPASLKLLHYASISARVMDFSHLKAPKHYRENVLKFKVQCAERRRPFFVQMRKDEKFRCLYGQCAEELEVTPDRLRLRFDNEEMLPEGVPSAFEMEGGEVIDVTIK